MQPAAAFWPPHPPCQHDRRGSPGAGATPASGSRMLHDCRQIVPRACGRFQRPAAGRLQDVCPRPADVGLQDAWARVLQAHARSSHIVNLARVDPVDASAALMA